MKTHALKVYPQFWPSLKDGTKPFEIRRNDRNYQVGDVICCRLYDPSYGYASGEQLNFKITYILFPEDFNVGLKAGYICMGLKPCN